jgi:hypothetical protein
MQAIVLAALLHAVAPAEAPADAVEVVLGGFRTVGLVDGGSFYRDKLEQELAAVGIRLVEPEAPLEPSCFEKPDCLQAAIAGKGGLLDLELVRAGPFLQIKLRIWGANGDRHFNEDVLADADVFPEEGELLPYGVHVPLGASGQPLAAAEEDDAVLTEELAPASVEQPPVPEDMPLLGYTGIGVAVVGGILVLGGGLLALSEMLVLESPVTLAPEKERARVLGPSALVAAGVGAVVLGGGGALASLGFAGE